MKRAFTAIIIGALAAAPLAAETATASSQNGATKYAVTVSVSPAETPGNLLFTAKMIRDGVVLSAPRVTFKAGQGAVVQSGSDVDGVVTRMTITSDAEKNTATVVVEHKQAEDVLFAPTLQLSTK